MQKKKLPRDPNALAARIVAMSTGQPVPNDLQSMTGAQTGNPPILAEDGKNPAAVALGRLGGLKGGKARAAALSAAKKKAIARKAATARWGKKKKKKPVS